MSDVDRFAARQPCASREDVGESSAEVPFGNCSIDFGIASTCKYC